MSQQRLLIISTLLLISLVAPSIPNAATRPVLLNCGQSHVSLVCLQNSGRLCSRSIATAINVRGIKRPMSMPFGNENHDFSADSIACAPASRGPVILVKYSNGGNCDQCEVAIPYDLNGFPLVTKEDKLLEDIKQLQLPQVIDFRYLEGK